MPHYELQLQGGGRPGPDELAPAATNVTVVRSVTRPGDGASIILPLILPPTAADGLGWLRSMAGDLKAPTRRLEPDPDYPQRYVEQVVAKRDALQAFVATLRARLVERGALTAAEAKVLDRRIEVVIDDQREDQTKPLPTIPEPAPTEPPRPQRGKV